MDTTRTFHLALVVALSSSVAACSASVAQDGGPDAAADAFVGGDAQALDAGARMDLPDAGGPYDLSVDIPARPLPDFGVSFDAFSIDRFEPPTDGGHGPPFDFGRPFDFGMSLDFGVPPPPPPPPPVPGR